MVNKATDIIAAVLLGLAFVFAVMFVWERHKASEAKIDVDLYKNAASTLSVQLDTAQKSYKVDLDAINVVQDTRQQLQDRSQKIKEKVDAVTKKVESGEITADSADAFYIDSMWETYCQRESDTACSTRRTTKKD